MSHRLQYRAVTMMRTINVQTGVRLHKHIAEYSYGFHGDGTALGECDVSGATGESNTYRSYEFQCPI